MLGSVEPIEVHDLLEPVAPSCEKLELLTPQDSKSPIPEVEIKPADSHPVFASFSPVFDQPKSPAPTGSITPDYISRDIIEKAQEHFEELCQPNEVEFTPPDLIEKAREHFEDLCHPTIESPQEDVTSSIKDDEVISPADENIINESFISNTSNLIVEEAMNVIESSSDAILVPEHTDTESITTAEVNSFLDRSLPPEVTSPISSPIDLPVTETNVLIHTQGEEIDIKTERITPEFAEQAIVTPSEESKQEDVPVLEETLKEEKTAGENETLVATENLVATTAAVAAIAAVGAAVAASPVAKQETKKSSSAVSKKPATKSATTTKAAPKTTSAKPLASAKTAPPKIG